MGEEAVPKLTVLGIELIFLILLISIFNQFIADVVLSVSAGLIILSLVTTVLAFEETIGITLMVFVFSLVFLSVVLGSITIGLFLSSIALAAFVLINVLTH
ncbi:MAG: hypothetical protein HYT72_00845 [Candidatus Aenigmarchaeota archaeon]|nr:hypothetical protein [Candidatus Aenigmarchaeota archaeon]